MGPAVSSLTRDRVRRRFLASYHPYSTELRGLGRMGSNQCRAALVRCRPTPTLEQTVNTSRWTDKRYKVDLIPIHEDAHSVVVGCDDVRELPSLEPTLTRSCANGTEHYSEKLLLGQFTMWPLSLARQLVH